MIDCTNKIALSFDVEDLSHRSLILESSISINKRAKEYQQKLGEEYDLITKPTLKILEILDFYNIQATFFLVADIVDKYPIIIQYLKNSRHEIACHGLSHEPAIDRKTKKPYKSIIEWNADLIKAKNILEKTFEKEIIGYRAPGAYFANWMIALLEKSGFKYDSSIAYNSFYNKTNIKLKNIPSKPYFLNKTYLTNANPDSNLVELPWSNLKITKRLILPAGGAYFFRLLGYYYFSFLISKNLNNNDTMFYLHPLDITKDKIVKSNYSMRPLYWINKGNKTEKNLIKLLKKYKDLYSTCYEIYNKYISISSFIN